MKIKKGDTVQIIAGKDRGKTGEVARILRDTGNVVVEGINMRKRHQRATRRGQSGQIIEFAAPIDASNVQIVDPKTKKPTRIRIDRTSGTRVRIAQKSGTKLD